MNENPHARQDPLEDAIRAFRRMSVPEPPPNSDVLRQFDTGPSKRGSRFSIPTPLKRRYLMRLLVPSAAAALVLIGGFTLFVFDSSPAHALADVVKAAEKHKLVKFQQKETRTDDQGKVSFNELTVFADLKTARFRQEGRHTLKIAGQNPVEFEEVFVTIIDFPKTRQLMVWTHPGGGNIPPRKEAALCPTQKNHYKAYLDAIREFQRKKGLSRGKDTIAGRALVRFRLEEKIKEGTLATTLWVDPRTDLPARELTSLSTQDGTIEWLKTDFEWDPQLPKGIKSLDELFSTKPPEGYQFEDKTREDK